MMFALHINYNLQFYISLTTIKDYAIFYLCSIDKVSYIMKSIIAYYLLELHQRQ